MWGEGILLLAVLSIVSIGNIHVENDVNGCNIHVLEKNIHVHAHCKQYRHHSSCSWYMYISGLGPIFHHSGCNSGCYQLTHVLIYLSFTAFEYLRQGNFLFYCLSK